MTNTDAQRFSEIMHGLAEDKGVQLSTAGIGLKFEALKQFPIDDIFKAALCMMGNKKFATMPSVADFIEYLGGGSVDDNGMIQAGVVWQAVRRHGGNRSVCFDDPVTQAVIVQGFGGWQKMCSEMMEDQQKWFMKDFAKLYGAFARRGVKEYGLLPGRSDPFDAEGKPALIGNRQEAQLVLEQRKQVQIPIIKER